MIGSPFDDLGKSRSLVWSPQVDHGRQEGAVLAQLLLRQLRFPERIDIVLYAALAQYLIPHSRRYRI